MLRVKNTLYNTFRLSDTNCDGKIDWDEFLQMMLPGHQEANFMKETEIKSKVKHWSNKGMLTWPIQDNQMNMNENFEHDWEIQTNEH